MSAPPTKQGNDISNLIRTLQNNLRKFQTQKFSFDLCTFTVHITIDTQVYVITTDLKTGIKVKTAINLSLVETIVTS